MKPTTEIQDQLIRRFLAREAPMQPGIYPHITNEAYHDRNGCGVSRSMLLGLLESPFDCYAASLDPARPGETDRQRQGHMHGTLAHCAIFEPDEFGKRYAVVPQDAPTRPTDRQRNAKRPSVETLEAIDWWDNFYASCDGKTIITLEQYNTCMRQGESVRRHAQAMQLLSEGMPEVSAFWEDEPTGLLCRVRPDWVRPAGEGGVILPDGKTYATANPDHFLRQIERSDYHVQAGLYSDGYEKAGGGRVLSFPFIAIKDAHPYTVSICVLDEASVQAGRDKARTLLDQFAACLKAGEWPGFPDVNLIALSRWKLERG